jgi:two-component system nitrogen regulation response regulator NtrX
MISGHGTVELAVNAIRKGAYDFIEKPFKTDRLLLVLRRATENARLKREVAELRDRAGASPELIGHSPAAVQLRQTVERVAPSNSRVLILGPAGAGKETVARLIHARSSRAEAPFVALNCATLHPDRIEAELFGQEGADRLPTAGILEKAHGGTLLLDEVADLPLETQGKMLRVLQDQPFTRLGGTTPIAVNVRILAASGKDLTALIAEGKFREDLFYRLRVVPILVPPLAERREDIPALARHLMERAAQRSGLPARRLGEDAIAAMQAYPWPGNVRQLSNVIDWLLIMTPADPATIVTAGMLPPDITGAAIDVPRWDRTAEIMALPLREARETFEREYLLSQIARFGGNISRTAAYVGMERSALHRKLRSLGLSDTERGGEAGRPRNYDA